MRGRVLSLLSLDRAMMTAGAAFAGFLADAQGVQIAQLIYGLICVAGGLAVLLLARDFRRSRTAYVDEPVGMEPATTGTATGEEPAPAPTLRAG